MELSLEDNLVHDGVAMDTFANDDIPVAEEASASAAEMPEDALDDDDCGDLANITVVVASAAAMDLMDGDG